MIMIEHVSPNIRSQLTKLRVIAMKNGVKAALERVNQLCESIDLSLYDKVAIGLFQSEIDYLDYRKEEALNCFNQYVEPYIEQIDPHIAPIVLDNKSIILLESFSTEDFYNLVDQRRILGVKIYNPSAILDADNNASKGKHKEALPVYWQQLKEAYENQNWRSMAHSEKNFAYECLKLNWLEDASYHAMLSRDEEAIQAVSEALLATNSNNKVNASLDKLLSVSSLKSHKTQLAGMISAVAETITDDVLFKVVVALSEMSTFIPSVTNEYKLFKNIWTSIEALANQLNKDEANQFVKIGINHPLMKIGNHRKVIIRALGALCTKIDKEHLFSLADASLKIVIENKSDSDYVDAVNLVLKVANADKEVSVKIRDALFPTNAVPNDSIMLQVAYHLGIMFDQQEKFTKNAYEAAAATRNQVQILDINKASKKIGGLGELSSVTSGLKKVVSIHGALDLIEALVPYRHLINEKARTELIDAFIVMISENENLICNRIHLISELSDFLDCLPTELLHKIIFVLEPLAKGDIVESSVGQTYLESQDPLNSFSINTGDPTVLQGEALMCLAKIDKMHPNLSPTFHNDLLLNAITNTNPKIRMYGLESTKENNNLELLELREIALSSLDPNPEVTRLALHTLRINQDKLDLEPALWHILVRGFELAAKSNDYECRLVVARFIKDISNDRIPIELRERITIVNDFLKNDFYYSVRTILQ
jgi:hypothetical protein